jgi:hypothetical protein
MNPPDRRSRRRGPLDRRASGPPGQLPPRTRPAPAACSCRPDARPAQPRRAYRPVPPRRRVARAGREVLLTTSAKPNGTPDKSTTSGPQNHHDQLDKSTAPRARILGGASTMARAATALVASACAGREGILSALVPAGRPSRAWGPARPASIGSSSSLSVIVASIRMTPPLSRRSRTSSTPSPSQLASITVRPFERLDKRRAPVSARRRSRRALHGRRRGGSSQTSVHACSMTCVSDRSFSLGGPRPAFRGALVTWSAITLSPVTSSTPVIGDASTLAVNSSYLFIVPSSRALPCSIRLTTLLRRRRRRSA